jgi:uncharacterized protein YdhG (YjbR/CyaY superfamily)
MNYDSKQINTIDQYIQQFTGDTKERLNKIRNLVLKAAPQSTEDIKYKMPTFILNGNLIHFAAYKKHIGIYPMPSGVEAFQKELAPYVTSKGAIQFPLDKPLPLDLIRRIVEYRVKENLSK